MRTPNTSCAIQVKRFGFMAIILLLLCFFPLTDLGIASQESQLLGPKDKTGDWVKHEVTGIPYKVGLDVSLGRELHILLQRRVIFVHLDLKHFTRDNALAVFKDISSKVPQPISMYVTLLADEDLLKKRIKNWGVWTSHDTSYTRLTDDNIQWCPQGLMGAQFDRYETREYYVLCTAENLEEIVKEDGELPRSTVIDRRLRRF